MKPVSEDVVALPENSGAITYLKNLASGGGMVHPDVHERLRELKEGVDSLVHRSYLNSEALVGLETGKIRVAAFGTAYVLCVEQNLEDALGVNKNQTIQWSDGDVLNLKGSFGDDWIEGSSDDSEIAWLS